jgi:hypothetical protein
MKTMTKSDQCERAHLTEGKFCNGTGVRAPIREVVGSDTYRAAELLHGHLAAALHFNAAVTLLLPFAIAYFAMIYWTSLRHNRFEWPSVPSWSWKLAVAFLAVFGFARMFTEGTL